MHDLYLLFVAVISMILSWFFVRTLVFVGLERKKISNEQKTLLQEEIKRVAFGPLIYYGISKKYDIVCNIVPRYWIDFSVIIGYFFLFICFRLLSLVIYL